MLLEMELMDNQTGELVKLLEYLDKIIKNENDPKKFDSNKNLKQTYSSSHTNINLKGS